MVGATMYRYNLVWQCILLILTSTGVRPFVPKVHYYHSRRKNLLSAHIGTNRKYHRGGIILSESGSNHNNQSHSPILRNLIKKVRLDHDGSGTITKRSSTISTKTGSKNAKPLLRMFGSAMLSLLLSFLVFTTTTIIHVDPALAKSYSQNARNLERLNAGDASGGSVYDNDPKTAAGRKRRAMTGCKIASARQEASYVILNQKKVLSERDCNTKVIEGETDFMLQAMQNLDCPVCPYGVNPDRSEVR